jgi:hypothetical protein
MPSSSISHLLKGIGHLADGHANEPEKLSDCQRINKDGEKKGFTHWDNLGITINSDSSVSMTGISKESMSRSRSDATSDVVVS